MVPPTLRGAATLRAGVCIAPGLMTSTFGPVPFLSNTRPWTIWQWKPEGLQFCRPFDPAILLLGISLKELIQQMHKIITFFSPHYYLTYENWEQFYSLYPSGCLDANNRN